MSEQSRFEVLLPRERRRELAELAAESGLSSADLVRLSIGWLLQNPGALLGRGGGGQFAGERAGTEGG
jgi:hypothetical protein